MADRGNATRGRFPRRAGWWHEGRTGGTKWTFGAPWAKSILFDLSVRVEPNQQFFSFSEKILGIPITEILMVNIRAHLDDPNALGQKGRKARRTFFFIKPANRRVLVSLLSRLKLILTFFEICKGLGKVPKYVGWLLALQHLVPSLFGCKFRFKLSPAKGIVEGRIT